MGSSAGGKHTAHMHACTHARMPACMHACMHTGDGLKLDPDDKKAAGSLYSDRAKAYKMLARSRSRGETRSEREGAKSAGGGGGGGAGEAAAAAAEEEEDVRAGASGAWRRCLQDAGYAIYAAPGVSSEAYILKAEALQALERYILHTTYYILHTTYYILKAEALQALERVKGEGVGCGVRG